MTEKDLYLRYRKFCIVDFPTVPEDLRPGLYKDLLKYERGLVFGDAIGLVTEFEFSFEVED